MEKFWSGFEKAAADDKGSWKRHLGTATGALGAGAAAYALSRGRGGGARMLTRTLSKEAPKGRLAHGLHKLIYGADDLKYITPGKYGRKPKTIEGNVLLDDEVHKKFYKGQHRTIGGISGKRSREFQDKLVESRMINKHAPDTHMPTSSAKVKGGGTKNLHAIHAKHKDNFIIKQRNAADTGVGNVALITKRELADHLAGRPMPPGKRDLIAKLHKHPQKFIVQGAIDMRKSPITKTPSELRVHAIGGKVVRGGTLPRSKNIDDAMSFGKAENAMQKLLDKLPEHQKKDLSFAADVALDTKGKAKIIELNRGGHYSGFADPIHLSTRGGVAGGAGAVRANQAIYKTITGRDSQLSAGVKAIGAGAGTAGVLHSGQAYLNGRKRNEKKQTG